MKVLIVESDAVDRKTLVDLVLKDPMPGARIRECANGIEAIAALKEFNPDILICEVESPGIDAFTLVETIPQKDRPAIIFISGVEDFAARAFDVSAVDYLLKPIREDRFLKAIQRARNHIAPVQNLPYSRKLAIRNGRSLIFVDCQELDWAEAEGKHVRLHMGKEYLLLRMSISALEDALDPAQFVRIHRSTIINMDRVRQIQPWNHRRTYQVILQDGTQLVLSRKSILPSVGGKSVPTFQ